MIFIKLVTT